MSIDSAAPEGEHAARTLSLLALAVYVPMALAGAIIIAATDGAAELGARLITRTDLFELGIGVAAGCAVVGILQLLRLRSRHLRRLERAFADLLGPLSRPQILLLAASSGIAEELLFRGALQPLVGLWITSIIFGLLHFPYRRELAVWPLFAFGTGLLLGALFERSHALCGPVAAHFVVNALSLELIARRAGRVDAVRVASNTVTRS